MQPYWAFGLHQVRWGFYNVSYLQGVVDNYAKANIQLESIMNDLDYLFQYRDFLNNPVGYPLKEFQAFIGRVSARGSWSIKGVSILRFTSLEPQTHQSQFKYSSLASHHHVR